MTDDQRGGAEPAVRYLAGNAAFLRYDRPRGRLADLRFHLAREHQRVHSAPQQEKHDPTA